jgi:hypothetical protein
MTCACGSPLSPPSARAGKYQPGGPVKPYGPRSGLFSDSRLREIQPLLGALKAVADARGKTMAQVHACAGVVVCPTVERGFWALQVSKTSALAAQVNKGHVQGLGLRLAPLTSQNVARSSVKAWSHFRVDWL